MNTVHSCLALLAGSLIASTSTAAAQLASTVSPDGSNRVDIRVEAGVPTFQVSRKGAVVITPSALGLSLLDAAGKAQPLAGLSLAEQSSRSGADRFAPPVGKTSQVDAAYRETRLQFDVGSGRLKTLGLIVRAYNDGVALRYVLPVDPGGDSVAIAGEQTELRFAADYSCRGLNQPRFEQAFEGEYRALKASQALPQHLYQAPFVCETGKAAFAIAESDLNIYPGAFYAGLAAGPGLRVVLTPRPDSKPEAGKDRIAAHVDLSRPVETPWRVIMLGDAIGGLIESNLIGALAAPSSLADTSWIKPGLSTWDWWHRYQSPLPAAHGAKAPAPMNTATYKAYADFAADFGMAYMMIDEGWSVGSAPGMVATADVTQPKPEMDMAEIARYAASKGVGVWIWLQWRQLERQLDQALALYAKWGIKGIKVDFMNRNDQEMLAFYHRLLAKAGEHKLMVNLHGAFPPAGLSRTYPHFVTQEGVMGAEFNRWSKRVTAKYNISLAFTRGLLGPMDYTPGGFHHATPEQFPSMPATAEPYVMTTRGAALAMYVIIDSPLQALADSPRSYRKADGSWEEGVDFLRQVPASWDETRFIQGQLDDHIVLARRRGTTWYLGAMTDKQQHIEIPLSFLGKGRYEAQSWQDGSTISSVRHARQMVGQGDRLRLNMAANGGAVAMLTPTQP